MFDHLIIPSQALAKGRWYTRRAAVQILFDAFFDVPLGTPMKLSKKERRSITRQAALEMAEAFTGVRGRSLTRDEVAELAGRVDPLWREIAAANWDIAGKLHEERVEFAGHIVIQLIMSLGVSVDEAADAIKTQVSEKDSPLMSGPVSLIMAQAAIAPHHIIAAVNRLHP